MKPMMLSLTLVYLHHILLVTARRNHPYGSHARWDPFRQNVKFRERLPPFDSRLEILGVQGVEACFVRTIPQCEIRRIEMSLADNFIA